MCVCVCGVIKMVALSHVFVVKTPLNHHARSADSATILPSFPPHPLDSLGSVSTGFILPTEGYARLRGYSDQSSGYHSQTAFRCPLLA